MTIVLKEIHAVDQTVVQGVPDFKGRALLAYGHGRPDHSNASARLGPASWGFRSETDAAYNAIGFGITSPGSLETGGARIANDGTNFLANVYGGPSVPTGQMRVSLFGCGELGLIASVDEAAYLGLFIMGGKTLQTKIGVGSFSGAGSLAITGVGFQPDLILMGGVGRTTLGGPTSSGDPFDLTYGAADGDGNQFACVAGSNYLGNTSAARISRTINNGCFVQLKPSLMKASLTSMDADGFTLNCTTYSGAQLFWWVAIHDPNGHFAVGTATENDTTFTPGFTPEAVMFATTANTAFDTTQGGARIGYGGASSDGSEYAGFETALAANAFSWNYWTTKAIVIPKSSTAPPYSEASVSSWGSTMGLTWTGVDSGHLFGWVAMKTSAGPGFDGCGGFVPQIYRWLKR